MPDTIRVEGVAEAQHAFQHVGRKIDRETEAAVAAGEALTPYISHLTRRESGALAAGWGVDNVAEGAAFINTQDYWTYQEFGTETVDPTYAIRTAWERNEDVVVKAYDEAVREIAEDAGFDQ